jgi:hypothetical protein
MHNKRDPTKCSCQTKAEDVVSVILAILLSILVIGLLGSIFEPSSSGGGSVKIEGTIGGSITVDGEIGKTDTNTEADKDNTGEGTDTENDNTADTDTTPDDEPKEEIVEDLSIKLCISVPSGNDHYAYITRDGVSTFYKMTRVGSDTFSLNIESFNLTDCSVVFCRMIEGYESVDLQNVLAQSETFTLENNKTYNVTFE